MSPETNGSTLVVRIGPTDRTAGEIAEAIAAVDAVTADELPGSLDEGGSVRTVEDEADVDRLLSGRVQETLKAIATGSPESIAALADHLDRPREEVDDDVEFLADLRIVSLRTAGTGSELAERPVFAHGSIEYEAVLRSGDSSQ